MGLYYGWVYYGWVPPRSRKQPKRERKFTPAKISVGSANPRMQEYLEMKARCPSIGNGVGNATVSTGPRYEDPELAKREAEAREVKHTVAPICNKGGYQLITNEADIKTAGRKV